MNANIIIRAFAAPLCLKIDKSIIFYLKLRRKLDVSIFTKIFYILDGNELVVEFMTDQKLYEPFKIDITMVPDFSVEPLIQMFVDLGMSLFDVNDDILFDPLLYNSNSKLRLVNEFTLFYVMTKIMSFYIEGHLINDLIDMGQNPKKPTKYGFRYEEQNFYLMIRTGVKSSDKIKISRNQLFQYLQVIISRRISIMSKNRILLNSKMYDEPIGKPVRKIVMN